MGTLLDADRDALAGVLAELGQARFRADQVWGWVYREHVASYAAMRNVPAALRDQLAEALPFGHLEVAHRTDAADGTTKWLLRAPDGVAVEAVLMRYPDRATVCVSSQAGCAMGCTFCATGQFGFERQLPVGEIVGQVLLAARTCREEGRRLSHVVFMGMGEPLANYGPVVAAIRRLTDADGLGISPRRVVVSTVGVVPGMRRLAEEGLPVTLAVSLHSAFDAHRETLVPLNRQYPLAEVVAAAAHYAARTRRRVSFEWTLMRGVNDDVAQARALAVLARRAGAHVNVIPLNPTPGSDAATPAAGEADRFVALLREQGVVATRRDTKGRDIDGACGQLRTRLAAKSSSDR